MTLLSASLPKIPSSPLSASSSSSTFSPSFLESVLVKRLLLDGKLENNEEFFVRLESEKRLPPENNPPPLVLEEDKLKAPNKGFFPLVSLLLESFFDKLPKSPPVGALLNKPPEFDKSPNKDSFFSLLPLLGCSFKFNLSVSSFLSLFDDKSVLLYDLISVLD